jgi:hypothetical protein
MTRPIKIVARVVGGLLLAGLVLVGVLIYYYRPTFEWAR